ncbi:MAG: sulfite exporter TauE/SafE family protein [Halobacteriales archaeon]
MEILGLSVAVLVLFVSFGFMVGVFFGFFGMGGSFLVTPALLILGYPATVAIGSSMAFVFGTAVIATLKHQDIGQVDYKLGALMFAGIALGVEAGKTLVLVLDALGRAEVVVGGVYVLLLAGIGALFTRSALDGDETEVERDEGMTSGDDDIPDIAKRIKSYRIPPMVTLKDGSEASLWTISGVGGGVGIVSGFLGVGGGFIRMPAIYYLIGVPLAAAVGTSLFGALMSGAIGAYTYGLSGVIDLGVVTALLTGSALGARIGSAATAYVDEDDVTIYFGIMLLLSSVAVLFGELANWLAIPILESLSFVLLVGSAVLVTLVIFYHGIAAIREDSTVSPPTPEHGDC